MRGQQGPDDDAWQALREQMQGKQGNVNATATGGNKRKAREMSILSGLDSNEWEEEEIARHFPNVDGKFDTPV